VAADGYTIVGMVGQISRSTPSGTLPGDSGPAQIYRIGLLQAQRPITEGYLKDHHRGCSPPEISALQKLLWTKSYGNYTPIWLERKMRLVQSTKAPHESSSPSLVHEDLVPQEALIWAANADELRRVTCLKGSSITSNQDQQRTECFPKPWRPYKAIVGLTSGYYINSSRTDYRSVGDNMESGPRGVSEFVDFEIKSQEGEFVEEVRIPYSKEPTAVKVSLSHEDEDTQDME
jgi:hypothetical protein